jgi:hypothetical protein
MGYDGVNDGVEVLEGANEPRDAATIAAQGGGRSRAIISRVTFLVRDPHDVFGQLHTDETQVRTDD